MQHVPCRHGILLCRARILPCINPARSSSRFDDRKAPRAQQLGKALGDRFMMSSPRSLAALAFGAWAVSSLSFSSPLTAATSFTASEAQRAAVQRLLDNPVAPVLAGQTLDIAAL